MPGMAAMAVGVLGAGSGAYGSGSTWSGPLAVPAGCSAGGNRVRLGDLAARVFVTPRC